MAELSGDRPLPRPPPPRDMAKLSGDRPEPEVYWGFPTKSRDWGDEDVNDIHDIHSVIDDLEDKDTIEKYKKQFGL
jgi:hypothetical protein